MSQEQHAAVWNAAATAWDQRWNAVTADQWEAASTCEGWNVQQLVDHTVGTQIGFAAAMVGAEVAEGAAWPEVHAAISAALEQPGALDGTINMPPMGGDVPKAMMFGIASSDMLMHTWDLARSIGADEQLPAEAVSACYQGLQRMPEEMMRAEGRFAAAVECAADADEQTQMLCYSGRQV